MIFYFSGTGNSRYIATLLAERLGDRAIDIMDTRQTTDAAPQWVLQKGERIGFVFPIYAWGPPPIVTDFMRRVTIKHAQGANYTYMVCTCGDDAGRCTAIVRRVLAAHQWTLNAAFSVTMPNTYVSLPGFDTDSPEVEKSKLTEALKTVDDIAERVKERRRNVWSVHEGSWPRLKSYVIRPLFHRFLSGDRPFHTTEACNGCGLCSRVCPTGNIDLKDTNRPQWNGQCVGCLRCYHTCPQHAIEYGRHTRGKGQYLLKKALSRCPATQSQK